MNFGTGTLNIKSAKVSRSIEKMYDRKTDRLPVVWRKSYIYTLFVLHERERTEIKKQFLTAINRRRMQQEMQLTHPSTIQFNSNNVLL